MTDADAFARRRAHYLDNRWLVVAVFGAALSVFLAGMLAADYHHADPRFVIDYAGTELQVTALLLAATAGFFPAARQGLRRPRHWRWRAWWPLAVLLVVTAGAWLAARLALPARAPVDMTAWVRLLGAALLVGLNEEWIFRGLAPAALSRWWGLRTAAYASLLLFGGFRLLYLAAGMPPAEVALECLLTALLGAIFLRAALATGSLLLPVLAHAAHDFLVIDMGTTLAASAWAPQARLVLLSVGLALGSFCLIGLRTLKGGEAYPG